MLQARAALALTAVGHDDVIEGLIAPPAPRQANGYHGRTALAPAVASKKATQKRARILRNAPIRRHFLCLTALGLPARKSGRQPPTLQRPQQPPQPATLHALHDALHLLELLEQPI